MAAAATAAGFSEFSADRAGDGAVLFVLPVTSIVIGRLSQKEVPTPGVFVLTEKAVYEFKGTFVTQKETRRIPWDEVHGLVLNSSLPLRFLPLIASSASSAAAIKNTRAYEHSARADFVSKMRQACASSGAAQALWVSELDDGKITTMLKALPQSQGRSWRELVSAADAGQLQFEPAAVKNADVRKSLRSTKSAHRRTPSGGSSGGAAVAAAAPSSFVSSLWDQLTAAMELPKTAEEQTCCRALTARMSCVLPYESQGVLAQPRDEAQALLAVALVVMDPVLCRSLVSCLLAPRALAQTLLEDLEEGLGSTAAVVRRWAAVAMFASLPTFEHMGHTPVSTGWRTAQRMHAEQSKLRESAPVRLLFPVLARKKTSAAGDDEDNVIVSSSMAAAAGKQRPPPLTSSNPNGGAGVGGGKSATRRASHMISSIVGAMTSGGGGGGGGATASIDEDGGGGGGGGGGEGGNTGGRKQRATLALVWLARLLDSEDLAPPFPPPSSQLQGAPRQGILKSDVQTLFQFLLGKTPDAAYEDARNTEFEVETFGAVIELPELFSCILASLTATRNEDVRCLGLKQLNVLLMRNNSAMRSVLSVLDWQAIIFSPLYNVPLLPSNRSPTQDDTYSYTLHMVTMLHLAVMGSQSACSEFGPLDKLFGQTLYKLAVNSGWGEPTVAVARSIFKGLFSTLAKQASTATCAWRFNPAYDEWEEIFRLSHLLQTFLFYRPAHMGLRDVSELVAKASRDVSSSSSGSFSDWRHRVSHHPLLNRVQNDRLLAAHRQMFAKMNLPVMTAAHRGEEVGIHLDDAGLCHDRSLVETAIKLWTALGVSGSEQQDRRKAEEMSTKADKSRILYASNVCRELTEVLRLFDLVDDKRTAVLKAAAKTSTRKAAVAAAAASGSGVLNLGAGGSGILNTGSGVLLLSSTMSSQQRDQLSAIAHSKTQDFLYKQKSKEQNVGFLSKAKSKHGGGGGGGAGGGLGLRSNLLQKRSEVVRKLGSGSDALEPQLVSMPSVVGGGAGAGGSHDKEVALKTMDGGADGGLRTKTSRLHIRADDDTVQPQRSSQAPAEYTPRQSNLDEPSVFEAASTAAAKSRTNSALSVDTATMAHNRRTLVKLKSPTASTTVQMSLPDHLSAVPMVPPSPSANAVVVVNVNDDDDDIMGALHKKRRSHAPLCFGCNLGILSELDEVQKFGQVWHAECLICSNCSKLVLAASAASAASSSYTDLADAAANAGGGGANGARHNLLGSGCKFFPNAGLLLCSLACEHQVLQRDQETRCSGCLDNLASGDAVITACGRKFHVETQCFRCHECDLAFDSSTPYFEVQDAVYCASCVDNKFRKCKCCTELLLPTDKVVEASQWQYHDRCFVCLVCKEPFKEGQEDYFPGQHDGELLCFAHHLEQRTPPCTFCHLPFNPKVDSEQPVAVAGLHFHRHCLQCSKCSRRLVPLAEPGSDEAAEEHDGQLFCTDCYVEEFGVQCHRCKLGIKGDVLHAGTGKRGEAISWHPECFTCQDCHAALLEQPFFLVAVGEEDLVSVCGQHFHSRYSNQTCPGCQGVVSPGRKSPLHHQDSSSLAQQQQQQQQEEEDAAANDVNALLTSLIQPPAASSSSSSSSTTAVLSADDNNPAIMYGDKMWHARCLTCEHPGCGSGLFAEFEATTRAATTHFKVECVRGLRVCATHSAKPHCFTCDGIVDYDTDAWCELMGWTFHERAECFCCAECKLPIQSDQALVKLASGPAHQKCPTATAAATTQKKPSTLLKRLSITLVGGKRA